MSSIKLISWNVNGFRACLKKGFIDSFHELDADIFCIQETKMQEGQAEYDLDSEKNKIFHEFWNSAEKKGYSGTAIFSKIEPLSVSYGMGIDEHDREGRIITLEFEQFYLINMYVPNSQRELLRLDYRMRWEDDFRKFALGLDAVKPVIICGDLNCAHQEIDLKNPKTNTRNAGFTIEERDKLSLLLDSGFADTFRRLYPDKHDAYTWWSYFSGARERNIGWRIDYFLVSERLMDKVTDADIHPNVYGSDHCPVELRIKNAELF